MGFVAVSKLRLHSYVELNYIAVMLVDHVSNPEFNIHFLYLFLLRQILANNEHSLVNCKTSMEYR